MPFRIYSFKVIVISCYVSFLDFSKTEIIIEYVNYYNIYVEKSHTKKEHLLLCK
jgi:hypothetical protein